jgi:hypothetical protein
MTVPEFWKEGDAGAMLPGGGLFDNAAAAIPIWVTEELFIGVHPNPDKPELKNVHVCFISSKSEARNPKQIPRNQNAKQCRGYHAVLNIQ